MSRKIQRGYYMWVPQKVSHICSYIDFFYKILHDFEVKNPISRIERIELLTVSQTQLNFYLQFCVFP